MDTIKILLVLITLTFGTVFGFEDYDLSPVDTNYKDLCSNSNITLNLNGLNLISIRNGFLSSSLITCLDLSNNNVQSVDTNAFNKLPNLKYLDLSDNNFDMSNVFSESHLTLETLVLDYMGNYYDVNINAVQPMLKKLFIRHKRREDWELRVPSNVTFPSLTHLYLTESWIKEDAFDWLPNSLQVLDLSGHRLSTLTLNNLENLTTVLLGTSEDRYLTSINFENLPNLKTLSVSSNQISEITSSTFSNLFSITYLDLSDNMIVNIEGGSFDSMKNLRFLNLSSNSIKILLSGTFDKLGNLHTLVLDKNVITAFPVVFKEMKLTKLFLNCNKLKSIIGGTFAKMPYLETLYLHDNEISFIDQDSFLGLKQLKTLTLSNNLLSNLPENWMVPMISLTDLDLMNNKFRNLADLSLSDSSPIQNLYIGTQLKFINATTLLNIPENITISMVQDFVFVEECVKNVNKYSENFYYG